MSLEFTNFYIDTFEKALLPAASFPLDYMEKAATVAFSDYCNSKLNVCILKEVSMSVMFRPADVHAGQREPGAGPRQGGPQDDPGVGRHGRLRAGAGRPVGGNMTRDTLHCVCRGSEPVSSVW